MRIIGFILLLFITQLAKADCDGSGIYVVSSGDSISNNSLILVEFYAHSQKLVDSSKVNSFGKLVSKSGKEVPLTIFKIEKGGFELTQVIFKINGILEYGIKYQLEIPSLDKWAKGSLSKYWDSKTESYQELSYSLATLKDTIAPSFIDVKYLDSTLAFYGCGPAVYANFQFEQNEKTEEGNSTPVFVETQLFDSTSNELTTYTLPYSPILKIGHGMCSGQFNFSEKHKYKIRFKLLDASGNTNNLWSKWINFDSPLSIGF